MLTAVATEAPVVSQKGDEAASVEVEEAARWERVLVNVHSLGSTRIFGRLEGDGLTVVVLRTMVRAATLNGALRTADVANIVSESRMHPPEVARQLGGRVEGRVRAEQKRDLVVRAGGFSIRSFEATFSRGSLAEL